MVSSSGRRQMVWMVVVVLGLLALAPTAGAAPPDAEARERCQGEGYRNLTTEEGAPFKSVGQCIKYVTQGGTLIAVPRIVRDFHQPFDTWCESGFVLVDFPAFTAVHVAVDGYIDPAYNPRERDVVTDASGFAYAAGMSVVVGTTTVTATFTAPTGESVTVVERFPCVAWAG